MNMILQKVIIRINERDDFVEIQIGPFGGRIHYRLGLVIAGDLRVAAKFAARYDGAPASFWREVEVSDLKSDYMKPHRVPRFSELRSTVKEWAVGVDPVSHLASLTFDDDSTEMDYETAVKVSHDIRRASRRAKAWAGDPSKHARMIGMLTDGEEDYKLGVTH